MWREADAPDGRKYYYHTVTQQTTWEKPADFGGPNGSAASPVAALPASAGEWKEAQAGDGRTYYYNTVTNATSWERPAGLQVNGNAAPPTQSFDRPAERRDTYTDQSLPSRPTQQDGRGAGPMPWDRRGEGFGGAAARSDEPVYQSSEEAEAAFFKLLRAHEIRWDEAWPDVIRKVGREKGFRAFKDAGERKEEFEKFCQEERALDTEREHERKKRRHDDFLKMLRMHDEIKYYTRYKTARPLLERETSFKNAMYEEERKQTFAEHRAELMKEHAQEDVALRQQALIELRNLMIGLVSSSNMKWQQAQEVLQAHERFQKDRLFRSLSKVEVLQAFEEHVIQLANDQNDKKQRQKSTRFRRERQARDEFKEMLQQRVGAGHIKAGTTWQDFYPSIAKEDTYLNLLGLPGSSPLDLFWDIVDEQEQQLRAVREDALDVLDAQQYEMVPETTLEEFAGVMARDKRTASISRGDLELIYKRIMEKVKRRHRDKQAVAERGQQDAIDDFRSALRHLDPPLGADDKYEEVATKIDLIPASRALSEDVKRTAFERHIRRLKDKTSDRRERDKDHRAGSRRSYDERDRDRDRRHRTRSPEIDAYEADRRKAQADRERQYRKSSFGLTPPPRERRGDRYERNGRRGDKYDNVYDRERGERELERERTYLSRADPRDKGKVTALDYGDDDIADSTSLPKRKGSEGSAASNREHKVSKLNSTNSDS